MRAAHVLQLGFVVVAGLAMYSFVNAMRDGERRRSCTPACILRPDYAGFDRRAPDFELPTIDGGKFRLSEHRGQVVILNFWTKTCRPCLEEMPTLPRPCEGRIRIAKSTSAKAIRSSPRMVF